MMIEFFMAAASKEIAKVIAGRLLTDEQITSVSNHVVGKYFSELLPTPENEAEAENRIAAAKIHMTEASNLILGLQADLEKQASQLEFLAKEIEQKKELAERYTVLAQTNQAAFSAFKMEMQETLRRELNTQNEKGKNIRRAVSFASWAIALVLGAFLGAWFQIQLEPKSLSPEKQPESTQASPNQIAPK
jgi:hypothetical protein